AREMKEQLKKAASILGLRIKPGSFEEQHAGRTQQGILTGLKAETEDGVLTVSSVGDISYRPSVGIIELPDEVLGDASSKEWSEDTVRYILSLYEKLPEALGLRNPTVVVDGHYIFTGEYWQTRIFVYESSDDPVENILSYTYPKLGLVKYYDGSFGGFGFSLAEKENIVPGKKLGEYPIVSASDAKDRLLSGFYASSCPDSIKGEEYIAKTELVYRHSIHDQYVMPYYRFWVMLDYYANENAEKNGLKTYAAYYVPALPDEYIADLTAWNGLFN
ncbi:MAG: hypothetical protein J5528_06520, partial [Firmicutes bacterium]|nr:hypothetical protein [Bacillota bacterium]